jgi:hypothetical protein
MAATMSPTHALRVYREAVSGAPAKSVEGAATAEDDDRRFFFTVSNQSNVDHAGHYDCLASSKSEALANVARLDPTGILWSTGREQA